MQLVAVLPDGPMAVDGVVNRRAWWHIDFAALMASYRSGDVTSTHTHTDIRTHTHTHTRAHAHTHTHALVNDWSARIHRWLCVFVTELAG